MPPPMGARSAPVVERPRPPTLGCGGRLLCQRRYGEASPGDGQADPRSGKILDPGRWSNGNKVKYQ